MSGPPGRERLCLRYELDLEQRFSPRTFSKRFLQYRRASDLLIAPLLDHEFVSSLFPVPKTVFAVAGVRLEHQINRHLSGFTRWSYREAKDRSRIAYGPGANPNFPVPNPSRGLQLPFVPRWEGLESRGRTWAVTYARRF